MAVEFVTVRGPNGNVGQMPKRAFENVFKDKGFELVGEERQPSRSGRDPALFAVDTDTADEDQSEPEPEPDGDDAGDDSDEDEQEPRGGSRTSS